MCLSEDSECLARSLVGHKQNVRQSCGGLHVGQSPGRFDDGFPAPQEEEHQGLRCMPTTHQKSNLYKTISGPSATQDNGSEPSRTLCVHLQVSSAHVSQTLGWIRLTPQIHSRPPSSKRSTHCSSRALSPPLFSTQCARGRSSATLLRCPPPGSTPTP
jgi:hypothetical protein